MRMGNTLFFNARICGGRRPSKRGQKWRAWEDLDDKKWIVLVEKKGGKEGEMEEWDLVEEFFHRIQDPTRMRKKRNGEITSSDFVISLVSMK